MCVKIFRFHGCYGSGNLEIASSSERNGISLFAPRIEWIFNGMVSYVRNYGADEDAASKHTAATATIITFHLYSPG